MSLPLLWICRCVGCGVGLCWLGGGRWMGAVKELEKVWTWIRGSFGQAQWCVWYGKEGREGGGKEGDIRRQGIVEHGLDNGILITTPAERSFLCNRLRQYPSCLRALALPRFRSTYLASRESNSPHHLSIAQHHTTINVCPFTLTSIISFLCYENNFCPVNNITHPFPFLSFPVPSIPFIKRTSQVSYHHRYRSRRSIT